METFTLTQFIIRSIFTNCLFITNWFCVDRPLWKCHPTIYTTSRANYSVPMSSQVHLWRRHDVAVNSTQFDCGEMVKLWWSHVHIVCETLIYSKICLILRSFGLFEYLGHGAVKMISFNGNDENATVFMILLISIYIKYSLIITISAEISLPMKNDGWIL